MFCVRISSLFSPPSRPSSSRALRNWSAGGSDSAASVQRQGNISVGGGPLFQRRFSEHLLLAKFVISEAFFAVSAQELSSFGRNAMAPEDVLNYWFGKVDLANKSYPFEFWFMSGKEVDDEILDKFGRFLDLAIAGDLNTWSSDIQGMLALVIILDQFSRNIFRGTPRAFAQDLTAQKLTLDIMKQGLDKSLGPFQRAFLYMPLMHSESLEIHSEAEQAYEILADDYKEDVDLHKALLKMVAFEKGHRAVLERYGRFPSRNAVLGRKSSAEEEAYLASEELWV